VRDYGLMVLAAEGDERAWDPMLATVSEILRRKRISYGRWYDMLHAVQYLARHAARGTERAEQLISLLRANWGTLARPPQKLVNRGPYVEPEMQTATRLEELWPGIQPDGPPGNAIDLPRLHTPIPWWRPDFKPPAARRNGYGTPPSGPSGGTEQGARVTGLGRGTPRGGAPPRRQLPCGWCRPRRR
jgi:hypothetical protein